MGENNGEGYKGYEQTTKLHFRYASHVAFRYKTDFETRLIPMLTLNTVTTDLESHWLKKDAPCRKSIRIGVIYRPPDGNSQVAINLIDNTLQALESTSCMAELLQKA